jgi:hypothetical protein
MKPILNVKKYTRELSFLVNKFACTNIKIEKFIKSSDALDPNQGITYLFLSDDDDFIIGYYNISVNKIDLKYQVGDMMYYEPMGGSININYFAIHEKFHKSIGINEGNRIMYFSDLLLDDCEQKIKSIRNEVGVQYITLYSTDQGYYLYNGRNDYLDFEDDMSVTIQESDQKCYKLYKIIDDLI